MLRTAERKGYTKNLKHAAEEIGLPGSPKKALDFLRMLQKNTSIPLTSFEIMNNHSVDIVLRNFGEKEKILHFVFVFIG